MSHRLLKGVFKTRQEVIGCEVPRPNNKDDKFFKEGFEFDKLTRWQRAIAYARLASSNIGRLDPWYGSISWEIPKPDTSQWPIHPLFARKRFVPRDEYFPAPWDYSAIRPSLALASRLLTEPRFLYIWYAIFFGKEQESCFQDYYRESKLPTTPFKAIECQERMLTRPEQDRTLKALEDMAKYVHIFFTVEDEVTLPGRELSFPVSDFHDARTYAASSSHIENKSVYHTLALNTHVFVDIAGHESLDILESNGINPNEIIRVQYDLAVTLVHELAHIAYSHRRGVWERRDLLSRLVEPCLVSDKLPMPFNSELGTAWARMVFDLQGYKRESMPWNYWGGDFRPLYKASPNVSELIAEDFPGGDLILQRLKKLHHADPNVWVIHLKYFHRFFTDHFWNVTVPERGRAAFKPPKEYGISLSYRTRNGRPVSLRINRNIYSGLKARKYLALPTPANRLRQLARNPGPKPHKTWSPYLRPYRDKKAHWAEGNNASQEYVVIGNQPAPSVFRRLTKVLRSKSKKGRK
ncbi:hypothetical protein BT63DRAFT_441296 [Microthyrium microscopicum]|uniref:Uncharacterized protein n=1 Tax=Microthyrium microscopicum TaxID=703497 RepID=A0A6A6U9C1_9PEZI|nr:hypothetical protein BT63DRAFT_441296 [Microthyrium microscopicum]